jgi:colanic acid biosynthesis glycosyl transferase WcaI
MRILITALNYAPETVGAGRYTAQIAEHLALRGHEVSVAAAPPYFPSWRVHDGYSGWKYFKERLGGVEVIRCPAWTPKSPVPWARVLHDASFSVSAAIPLLRHVRKPPDTVLAVAPSILSSMPALAVAKITGARSVLHVHDLELSAAKSLGMLPGWLIAMAQGPEAWIMRGFDRVVAVSGEMAAAIGGRGGLNNVQVVRNWADLTMNGLDTAKKAWQELGIPKDRLVVLYAGSLGRKQGLEVLIETANLVRDERIAFVICGDGPMLPDLERRATTIPGVIFLPQQDASRFAILMDRADVHVIPQRRGVSGAFMPSKLANICACGGALVCLADEASELASLARAAGGRICRPGDTQGLADAVRELADNPGLCSAMGKSARNLAKSAFDRKRALALLESQILSPA